MLLGSLSYVFIVGSNVGQIMFRGKVQEYWLPTPFACFPFTSPPVRHHVPSDFNWTLPLCIVGKLCFIKLSVSHIVSK